MEEEEKKNTWGGARRQGRTQKYKTYGIDNDLIVLLATVENPTRFVNDAIREKFKKKVKNKS